MSTPQVNFGEGSLYQAVLIDGAPEKYNKWASTYDADYQALESVSYKSVCDKWHIYHQEVLGSPLSGERHRILDAAGMGTTDQRM